MQRFFTRQLPKDPQGTASFAPRIPDKDYPQSRFLIDGPLFRLASNPATGLSLRPSDKQVIPNAVSMSNILDQWRRADSLLVPKCPDLPNSNLRKYAFIVFIPFKN